MRIEPEQVEAVINIMERWGHVVPTSMREALIDEFDVVEGSPQIFTHSMTVRDAQQLLARESKHGATCPVCLRPAKIYRRKLNSGMARSVILMYAKAGHGWLHVSSYPDISSREEGKLAHWGLVEESSRKRADGGRGGWWRVTEHGAAFARGEVKVRSHILTTYNKGFLGYSGDLISIEQALGEKFDYEELMNG